jgi:hypothetical protein
MATHGITVFHAEIVVFEIDVEEREDELRRGGGTSSVVVRSGRKTSHRRKKNREKKKAETGRLAHLLTNLLPDDPGHLVTVKLDDGVLDLDLLDRPGLGRDTYRELGTVSSRSCAGVRWRASHLAKT